jgi:hypothetical protein
MPFLHNSKIKDPHCAKKIIECCTHHEGYYGGYQIVDLVILSEDEKYSHIEDGAQTTNDGILGCFNKSSALEHPLGMVKG